MNSLNTYMRTFIKSVCYVSLASLLASNAWALNGPNAVGDCGQQRVQPNDDFSLLNYLPGDLPDPSTCEYPNVGTAFEEIFDAEGMEIDPNKLFQLCSGSIIHIDDKKAIYLSAAHCVFGGDKPLWVNFEPQPAVPYSFLAEDPDTGTPGLPIGYRDKSTIPMDNLIRVEGQIIHPFFSGVSTDSFDIFMLILDNSNGQIDNLGIQPLRIPDQPLYLESIKRGDLNKLTWTGVGYPRLERTLGNDPDATVADDFKDKRIAQHNRTYADLDFAYFGSHVLGISGYNAIVLNQQTNAGRDGTCNGDSGGPLIIEGDLVIGVTDLVLAIGGNPPSGDCDLQSTFVRTDLPANWEFIKCATDPNKTIAEALECESIFD